MKKIGLTGGIGSGKTTISKVFELLGVPVYNSDEIGKKILKKDGLVQQKIKTHFGKKILTNNEIDNKKLANIIFKEKSKLKIINDIIHPLVKKDFKIWCERKNHSYIIKESALLFKSDTYTELDEIIFVKSPLELRKKRILQRDEKTNSDILSIIKNQSSDAFFEKKCDIIIYNNETKFLIPQILKLHDKFIK